MQKKKPSFYNSNNPSSHSSLSPSPHNIQHTQKFQPDAKIEWTTQELDTIILAHEKFGNKWTQIAELVGNNRTESQVKNWFYSFVRRVARKIKRNAVILHEREDKSRFKYIKYICKFFREVISEEVMDKKYSKYRKKKEPYITKIISTFHIGIPELEQFEKTLHEYEKNQESSPSEYFQILRNQIPKKYEQSESISSSSLPNLPHETDLNKTINLTQNNETKLPKLAQFLPPFPAPTSTPPSSQSQQIIIPYYSINIVTPFQIVQNLSNSQFQYSTPRNRQHFLTLPPPHSQSSQNQYLNPNPLTPSFLPFPRFQGNNSSMFNFTQGMGKGNERP